MSKTFAFVKEHNGEVAHTMLVGNAVAFTSGTKYGDYVAIDITQDRENEKRYITDKYFDQGVWRDKPAKPNEFYVWTLNQGWVFDQERFYAQVRKDRDTLLIQSDWTQFNDSPLSAADKEAWATYRQQLRDITEHLSGVTDLEQVPWPTEPV